MMKKEANFSISSSLFQILLLAILAYPITYVIQKVINVELFSQYNSILNYLIAFVMDHKLTILVVLISYLFCNSKKLFLKTAKHIRLRHLDLEVERWNETPYIAPLHLYYLFFPPASFSSNKRELLLDYTYRYSVEHYRNRIYKDLNYTAFEPKYKPSIFQVIGKRTMVDLLIQISILLLVSSIYYFSLSKEDQTISIIFIPLLVLMCSRSYSLIKALVVSKVNYNKANRFFVNNFGEAEPLIYWGDTFPNKRFGQTILDVWKSECLIRQQIYDKCCNRPNKDAIIFDCPSLPEPPYTADTIPDWAEAAEKRFNYLKIKSMRADNTSRSNIVQFEKIRTSRKLTSKTKYNIIKSR